MNKTEIEFAARELQKEIWFEYQATYGAESPYTLTDLVNLFDPEIAARTLGVKFYYLEEIRFPDFSERHSEIAGLIDRQAGVIAVSKKFTPEVIKFTGAHEIGHWILHRNEVMHRDRPIKGLTNEPQRRSLQEQEADYFAACFLMPRKLVQNCMEHSFKTGIPFEFNEETSFWLCPGDPDSLLNPNDPMDRAMALASAETYKGRHFVSLAKRFQVSTTTMAIRLAELNLIVK